MHYPSKLTVSSIRKLSKVFSHVIEIEEHPGTIDKKKDTVLYKKWANVNQYKKVTA